MANVDRANASDCSPLLRRVWTTAKRINRYQKEQVDIKKTIDPVSAAVNSIRPDDA
jgi:hypothetical protein